MSQNRSGWTLVEVVACCLMKSWDDSVKIWRHLHYSSHVENFWGIVSPNDQQVQNIVSPVDILPVQK